jgi:hypothetical protein
VPSDQILRLLRSWKFASVLRHIGESGRGELAQIADTLRSVASISGEFGSGVAEYREYRDDRDRDD